MTRRKRKPLYEPIELEAQQANGEWCRRNAFIYENAKVQCGEETREWLTAIANRTMVHWFGFDTDKPLRVTGQPHKEAISYNPVGEENAESQESQPSGDHQDQRETQGSPCDNGEQSG